MLAALDEPLAGPPPPASSSVATLPFDTSTTPSSIDLGSELQAARQKLDEERQRQLDELRRLASRRELASREEAEIVARAEAALAQLERQLAHDARMEALAARSRHASHEWPASATAKVTDPRPWRSAPKLRPKPRPAYVLPAYLQGVGCGHDYSTNPPQVQAARPAPQPKHNNRPGRVSGDGRYDGKGGVFIRPAGFDRFMRPSSSTSLRPPRIFTGPAVRSESSNPSLVRGAPAATSGSAQESKEQRRAMRRLLGFDPRPNLPGVNAPKARGYFYENGKFAVYDGKNNLDGSPPPRLSIHPARKRGTRYAGGGTPTAGAVAKYDPARNPPSTTSLSAGSHDHMRRLSGGQRESRSRGGHGGGGGAGPLQRPTSFESLFEWFELGGDCGAGGGSRRNGELPTRSTSCGSCMVPGTQASSQASLLVPRSLDFEGHNASAASVTASVGRLTDLDGFSES